MKSLAVFLLVFSMVALTSAVRQAEVLQRSISCPSGWTLIHSRCFQYVQKAMSWATAERNCLSMGANLASVRDLNEYRQIQAMIDGANYGARTAWIGGTDAPEWGTWLWSDGSNFSYSDWCRGEPNNQGDKQHCVQMNYSDEKCWDDSWCGYQQPSVCAKKL